MTTPTEALPLALANAGPGRQPGRSRRPRLFGHEGGATAVEFAMIAPVFLLLVFVIAELALVFIAEELMDRAVKETARMVRTGQVHAAKMNKKEFHDALCGNVIALLDCRSKKDFYFDVTAYDNFAAVDSTAPVNKGGNFKDGGKADFGGPNDIVVVRIYYQWPTSPVFGELSLANLENGRRLIGSMAAFRNEPFPPVLPGAKGVASASSGAGSPGVGAGGDL